MCDFSKYGGKSDEWLALKAGLPPAPAYKDLLEKQTMVTKGREAVSSESMKALSPLIRMVDYRIPTRDGSEIEARSYRPLSAPDNARLPIYIHLHGGGFFFGSLSSEDAICARIALGAAVTVVNVNYRHTPDHPYPVAWNDIEDAFGWVHDHIEALQGIPEQVVIGGISAGAQLAASLTLKQNVSQAATSRPKIAGQILMIPCVVHMNCYESHLKQLTDPALSSYTENEHAPILSLETVRFFVGLLKTGDPEEDDLNLNPGNASTAQVKGLPPTVLGIAGLDPLRDEGLLYGKKLAEAGVPTDIHVFKGLPHGFRRFGDKLSESKRWDEIIENGIKWALSNPTPSGEFRVQT